MDERETSWRSNKVGLLVGRRNDEEWRSFLGSGQERTRREANGPVFASGVQGQTDCSRGET